VTDCPCAECTADHVCRTTLDRYWPPEVWLSRVGTLEERNDWRPRKPDVGHRGELRSGGDLVPTNEIHGEL
jgi:hypothetical protein